MPIKSADLFPPIPADTARTARAIFGSSNFYMATGDHANALFQGLFRQDPPAIDHIPNRLKAELYLITVFQYLETLPDSQAADAIRERRDWKYALHLPLNISGFKASMFCQFRKRLLADPSDNQVLQVLLSRLAEFGVLNGRTLRLEAYQVILQVCLLSRVASVWEAFSCALQALAIRQPDQLRAISRPYWYERYSQPQGKINLKAGCLALEHLAMAVGGDGFFLLEAFPAKTGLADLPELVALRQALETNYEQVEGEVIWRKDFCANCSNVPWVGNPVVQA